MSTLYNPSRRRLLSISACAVAGVSMGGALAAVESAGSRSPTERTLARNNPCAPSSTTGCAASELKTHHFSAQALGAGVTLEIVHFDAVAAERIATLAFTEIARLERIFSLYNQDSSLVELNTRGRLDQPPAELLAVFSQATGIWLATEGAFDPTVQPHWSTRHSAVSRHSPFSWSDVKYSTTRIEFSYPGMAITLNGIAQGYISEQIANLLRKHGLQDILVNVGEIVAIGNNSDGKPWQVGVAELQSDSAQYTLALTDTAIATSAPLSRITGSQAAYGHIIDPATSRPCDSIWQRLSVIHPSAAIADGLSTGLVMKSGAGIKRAISYYPQARVLAADPEGGQYTFVHSIR